MSKVDALLARLTGEEGERAKPYDDATGLPVRAPQGNLSWGRGFNLMQCGSPGLFAIMERYLVGALDAELSQFPWYAQLDDVRGSVPLDIAYNEGLTKFLGGWPHFIAALARGDLQSAAAECHVEDPKIEPRYAKLAKILLTGQQPT